MILFEFLPHGAIRFEIPLDEFTEYCEPWHRLIFVDRAGEVYYPFEGARPDSNATVAKVAEEDARRNHRGRVAPPAPAVPLGRRRDDMRRLLSWLLFLANSDPPFLRERFYALKDSLLRRWGERDGEDWQEIVKLCYRCDGTGYSDCYDEMIQDFARCRRCHKGVYERKVIRLERWKFSGRVFHRPAERFHRLPAGKTVTIQGRVQHKDVGFAGREAGLWLALAFDWGLFWGLLTGTRSYGRHLYPLLNLQRAVWVARSFLCRLKPHRCWDCGRLFLAPWKPWQSYCRACARRAEEEVPF